MAWTTVRSPPKKMASAEFREFAPAKINLFLHVLGRRDDGYHELESLAVFADVGDHLSAAPAAAWGLSITGPFAEDLQEASAAGNLVLKAARLAAKWVEEKEKPFAPLHFTLEKHLPIAAGLGGGSADAGAALRVCAGAVGLAPGDGLSAQAAEIGADVPACLYGRPVWMSGIGEALQPASLTPHFAMVLVNPGVQVSTARVFAGLEDTPSQPISSGWPDLSSLEELIAFLRETRNDLEAPARKIAPEIGAALEAIEATGPLLARMSGSGATCFGLYPSRDAADAAAASIREAHHDWWVAATGVLVST